MNAFLRQWKIILVFAAVLSCMINLLQLTFSFYMFAIFGVVIQSFSEESLVSITLLALLAIVFLALFSHVRARLLRCIGLGLEKRLNQDIMRVMLTSMAGPVKQTYQQGLSDLLTLRSFLSSDALAAIFDIPWAPFYLALIFFFHPLLGSLALAGALVTLGLTVLQNVLTQARLAEANRLALQNRQFMDTALKNAEIVNAMGMGQAIYDRFDVNNTRILLHQTRASRYAALSQNAIKVLQTFMNVVIYGASAYLTITEGFNSGLMIAASIIMGQAISPFMRTIFAAKTIAQAKEAYKRLHGLSLFLERQPDRMPLPAPQGALVAEQVSVALAGRVLLRNVSLSLRPGEFLGLIGPNGAGKSTLSKVLLGIWPAMLGAVRLDGADIARWDKRTLGSFVGYLPQEIELFPATVAENIARLGSVDMDEVRRVCDLVGITDLISGLPEGFETQVGGKDGVTFSGGQKQRVGLARALYGRPCLLVLDEPNSNLDEAGEAMLVRALDQLRTERGTTCILITHKLPLLRVVDTILMLQHGQVAHSGPRDAVLAALTAPASPSD